MKSTPFMRPWLGALFLTTALLAPEVTLAQQPTIGGGGWYYQLGGAAPISPSPNVNARSITIEGSAGLQLPRACGSLDPTIAISNLLGDVQDGLDNLDGLLVAAATNAIAALPAIILQRANPGLYEHFQNALLSARETYDLSVKSCQEIVEAAEGGNNPFSGWVDISRRGTWQRRLADPDLDSVDAETEVNQLNGDDGVAWVAGEPRGGADQEPIEIIRDVVEAGYNVTLGQPIDAQGAPPAIDDARLLELWATPEEAGDFAVEVLGDNLVLTCQGCTSSSTAGVGLSPTYGRERQRILEELTTLANAGDPVTPEALEEISAASIVLTPQLLEATRAVGDAQDRAVLVTRLAGDVATARTVEQALSLRRLLYTGKKTPEVSAYGLALEHLDRAHAELEQEIEAFLYEFRVQKELISATAATIIDESDRLVGSATGAPDSKVDDPDVLLRGGVQE